MIIKGLQKLTLLDYPGKLAATVFTGGCNFRCPFCHNASLVLSEKMDDSSIDEGDFFSFLEKRRGMLEGVCITGGEPTLQKELLPFLNKIKELGFLVKLDTNGYKPFVLKEAVKAGLCDYVAMDIKNSKKSYSKTVCVNGLDISKIEESAAFLMSGAVDFEFRTTLVRELHTADDINEIGVWLAGNERFFLQTFKDSGDTIGAGFGSFDEKETDYLLNVLKLHIPNAQKRG